MLRFFPNTFCSTSNKRTCLLGRFKRLLGKAVMINLSVRKFSFGACLVLSLCWIRCQGCTMISNRLVDFGAISK